MAVYKFCFTPPRDAQRSLRTEPVGFEPDEPVRELYYLFPEKLFECACGLDPHSEAFSKWHLWAAQQSVPKGERVAKVWSKFLPGDVEPLLYLMQQAEGRSAFPAALGCVAAAERIDGVNPTVRAARFRLLARSVLGLLQKRKTQPAAAKPAEMSALPQAEQGDRPVFIAAMHCSIGMQPGDSAILADARRAMARAMGSDLAADLLLANVMAEIPMPDGGVVLNLSSTNPALVSVPATLAIPGEPTMCTCSPAFLATCLPIEPVTVSAAFQGVARAGVLTVLTATDTLRLTKAGYLVKTGQWKVGATDSDPPRAASWCSVRTGSSPAR
jgi:hypothetical protein